jgi:hypothetical protein
MTDNADASFFDEFLKSQFQNIPKVSSRVQNALWNKIWNEVGSEDDEVTKCVALKALCQVFQTNLSTEGFVPLAAVMKLAAVFVEKGPIEDKKEREEELLASVEIQKRCSAPRLSSSRSQVRGASPDIIPTEFAAFTRSIGEIIAQSLSPIMGRLESLEKNQVMPNTAGGGRQGRIPLYPFRDVITKPEWWGEMFLQGAKEQELIRQVRVSYPEAPEFEDHPILKSQAVMVADLLVAVINDKVSAECFEFGELEKEFILKLETLIAYARNGKEGAKVFESAIKRNVTDDTILKAHQQAEKTKTTPTRGRSPIPRGYQIHEEKESDKKPQGKKPSQGFQGAKEFQGLGDLPKLQDEVYKKMTQEQKDAVCTLRRELVGALRK